VRFVPAADPAEAQLLIGLQAEPRGIAFTDLILAPEQVDGTRRAIAGSAICFNPDLPWEIGSFDGDPATPNVFYVSLHELGHVLGLDHMADDAALMTFRNLEHVTAPQAIDLVGGRALYGAPVVEVVAAD